MTPYVDRITLYPLKSFDGIDVEQCNVLPSGALEHDRTYAFFDADQKFVNGKRYAKLHQLRATFDLAAQTATLRRPDSEATVTFQLEQGQTALTAWVGAYFNQPVQLRCDRQQGFPDDTDSPGPTIISTATLEAIASWYPDLNVDTVRRRFRSNIEIGGVPAFWEDQLFTTSEQTIVFQVGSVTLEGINPCQRCVVVTRNPETGEPYPNFQKMFLAQRQATLPDWVERSRFNHFFRLAVNTRRVGSGSSLSIQRGDHLMIKP
ncbi:MAG: MOSC N-terminal beta barrel domain-containing protein [Cyanobacteria bacterium P01_H01_bin.121]